MTKYVVVALLTAGLAAAANTEDAKERQAAKPDAPAKTAAKADAGNPAAAAKEAATAKEADQPAPKIKQTPFGPVEAKPEVPPPVQQLSSDPMVSAEEKGDTVIFRRKTPFGNQVWKKKKSQLTSDELKLLGRDVAQPPGEQPPDAKTAVQANPPAETQPKP